MSLRFGVLGLIHQQPMTGYAIYQYFDQVLSHMWYAQQSQVYRELGQLEKDGLLSSVIEPQSGKPNKRVYAITAAGKTALKEWLESFDFSESLRHRDSFALRIFFAGYMPDLLKSLIANLEIYIQYNDDLLNKLDVQEHELRLGQNQAQLAGEHLMQRELFFFELSLMRGKAQYAMNIQWAKDALVLCHAQERNHTSV